MIARLNADRYLALRSLAPDRRVTSLERPKHDGARRARGSRLIVLARAVGRPSESLAAGMHDRRDRLFHVTNSRHRGGRRR
jgi:hypothetical protein